MDDFTRRHRAAAAEASRDYKTGRGPATAAALDAFTRVGARVDAEIAMIREALGHREVTP